MGGLLVKTLQSNSDGAARVEDEGDLRKYRIELPNLLDDLALSVYAFRLYAHIKRRAGAAPRGVCNEGLRGMARHCKMSLGTAAKARQELLDKKLIRVRVEIVAGTGRAGRFEIITVVDIWATNFERFDPKKNKKRGAYEPLSDGVSPHEHPPDGVSPDEQGCVARRTPGVSPHERKKEPLEERTSKKEPHTRRARATSAPPPAVAGVGVDKNSRHSLEARKAHAARNNLGGGWLTNSKDGRYDEAIDAELERLSPEAVEQSRNAPPDNRQTFFEADAHIKSVLAVGARTNVSELIASLNASDDVRARLRERYLPHPVAASSHSSLEGAI
jgi:hypothetical protein